MTTSPLQPPALAERFLAAAVRPSPYADEIVGDLHEAYRTILEHRSSTYARWWYRAQAIRLGARYLVRARRAPSRRSRVMDRLFMEIRFAARSLRKRPALTMAAAITLALGLGANATIFGVIDALILRPYNLPDVDRAVMVVETSPNGSERRETVSAANFLDWRRDVAGTIDHLSAMEWWDVNLAGIDTPERALGFHVSTGFFAAMGVQPVIGRGFLKDEETRGKDRVVVLGDALWRRRFGADPGIVGGTILADGVQMIVVGVAPPSLTFPMSAELWAPLAFDPKTPPVRGSRYLTVVGRLHEGRTLQDARAEMAVEAARLAKDYPKENGGRSATVFTISRGMSDEATERVLVLWQAAALFVLLIACANIANLQLARGSERSREIAVRLALGCSRSRIVRESLIESIMLAIVAVPLSLGVSWIFLTLMRWSMPARIIRFVAGWNRMTVDGPLIALTVVMAVVAGVAFGLLPALHIARGHVAEALKGEGRTSAGPGRQRLRRALVVAEVALVLPMLVAATLSVRSVSRFLAGWQGYDPNGVLTLKVVLPDARYPDEDSRRRYVSATLERLSAVPSVTAAVAANSLPSSDSDSARSFEIDGQPVPGSAKPPRTAYRTVSDQYFAGLRIPIVAGRSFTREDQPHSAPVAIVNQSFAKKFWPDGNAVGSRMRMTDRPWMTVVGVSGDLIHDWFDGPHVATFYVPLTQMASAELMYAVRSAGDPLGIATDVRNVFTQTDGMQPVFDVMTMRQMLSEKTVGLQFIAGVMGTFAALALVLAVVGLYAVMSYLVAQRVREIGVRIALGASAADVTRLALGQAAQLTAIGVALGLALAMALSRAMEVGLLGIVSADLKTPLALAALLSITGLASSYLPARRAAAVDPMVALRTE